MRYKRIIMLAAAAVSALLLIGYSKTGKGAVYYLNFKAEQDAQWQQLAKEYTEKTGVKVDVVTAASGNYETMLMSEMGKSSAPTMFQIDGSRMAANWAEEYKLIDEG